MQFSQQYTFTRKVLKVFRAYFYPHGCNAEKPWRQKSETCRCKHVDVSVNLIFVKNPSWQVEIWSKT